MTSRVRVAASEPSDAVFASRPCAPGARGRDGTPRRGLFASDGAARRARVSPRSRVPPPSSAAARRAAASCLVHPAAAASRRRRGGPSTSQWRSLVWLTTPRACPHGCGGSLRGRIRPPASTRSFLRERPGVPVRWWLSPAWTAPRWCRCGQTNTASPRVRACRISVAPGSPDGSQNTSQVPATDGLHGARTLRT